jgi:hypothetical protein
MKKASSDLKGNSPSTPKVQPTLRTVGDGTSAITSFLNALNDPSFSDVKFIMDDGTEYHAHRCILAARSSSFRAMLFGDHDEGKQHDVRVKEIDAAHFLTILEWAYSGTATMSAADVLGVMKLAGFYIFPDLEKHCRDLAMGFIDVSNVFILLNSALDNGEDAIVERCLDYLKSHIAEAIETPSWFALCSTGVQDVLSQQQMDISEFILFQRTCEWIEHHATDEQHRVALLTSFLPRIRLSQLTVQELLNHVKPIVNGYGVQQREYVESLEFKLAPEHFRTSKTLDRLCPRLPTYCGKIVQNVNRRFLTGWRCVVELDASKPLPIQVLQEINLHSTTYIAFGESVGQNISIMAVGNVDVALRKARSHTVTPLQDGAVFWFNGGAGLTNLFGFSPTSDQRVTYDVSQSERDRKLFWEVTDQVSEVTNQTSGIGVTRFLYVK